MSATDVLAVIAAAFGIGMGASPLLQARRAHLRRSADDVSLGFLAILMTGGIAWLSYGVALGNPALVVANGVGVLGSGTAALVALRYRSPGAAPEGPDAAGDCSP